MEKQIIAKEITITTVAVKKEMDTTENISDKIDYILANPDKFHNIQKDYKNKKFTYSYKHISGEIRTTTISWD